MKEYTAKERRARRRKGIIAGAAGAALLLGGSTFALWSDSVDIAGASITAGNLDISPVPALQNPVTFWDISSDRTDRNAKSPASTGTNDAHAIASDDIAGYRIVPGDTLLAAYKFDVVLEGDNLVATLNGQLTADGAVTTAFGNGLTVTYEIYLGQDATGTLLGSGTFTGSAVGKTALAVLEAPVQGGPGEATPSPAATPGITLMPSSNVKVTVLVKAAFSSAVSGQTDVSAQKILGDLTVSLEQVRNMQGGNGSFTS
jgi:alternate signal-mediated exported protein